MRQYIGKRVQLIYIDRNRQVSIRDVDVLAIRDGRMKAYCYAARALRVFAVERIVDIEEIRHAIG